MSFEAMSWAVKQVLPAKQKIVLLMLADRVNKDTGRCDPSIARLATDCGMSATAVKEAIRRLKESGHVVAHERVESGVNLPNQYELVMCDLTGVGQNTPGGGAEYAGGVGRISPPNLEDKPVREPELARDALFDVQSNEEPDRFDAFWTAYPKKAGKPAARKAWDKAIKKQKPDRIIAAARVYAQSEAVARGFAKFPQGWLNDERFNDPELQTETPRAVKAGREWFGETVR